MSAPGRRYGPDESPSIRVKHGQGPNIAIRTGHMVMDESADGVHVRVAMRDHDSLRIRSRTTRVIDGKQVTLRDLGLGESGRRPCEDRLVIQPIRAICSALQGNEFLDSAQLAT